MQIHITSDVALNVVNYLRCTGDVAFFLQVGLEILLEAARYWVSRVSWSPEAGRYEIRTVTGTDEHHPYVDNNAYTNYSVYLVLRHAVRLYTRYRGECGDLAARIGFQDAELDEMTAVADKLYLPFEADSGMIPQFDGYFQLSRIWSCRGAAPPNPSR